MQSLPKVTAETLVNDSIEKVWEFWTEPQHIKRWNNISEDWHTPKAENDMRIGGKLLLRMEAKDGSDGFDYEGTYDDILTNERISYTTSDGRKVTNSFTKTEKGIKVSEVFEIQNADDPEFHRSFCQAILDSFKAYVENSDNNK